MSKRMRYTLIGKATLAPGTLEPWDHDDFYVFTANQEIMCSNDKCRRMIPQGDEFTRRELNQRTERFSQSPTCGVCHPFTKADAP